MLVKNRSATLRINRFVHRFVARIEDERGKTIVELESTRTKEAAEENGSID